jgi:hypothetical protein
MRCHILLVAVLLAPTFLVADEKPLQQEFDYSAAMRKVATGFHGNPGVVLHVGDSITYSNPYGQWARNGQGKSEADKAILHPPGFLEMGILGETV